MANWLLKMNLEKETLPLNAVGRICLDGQKTKDGAIAQQLNARRVGQRLPVPQPLDVGRRGASGPTLQLGGLVDGLLHLPEAVALDPRWDQDGDGDLGID